MQQPLLMQCMIFRPVIIRMISHWQINYTADIVLRGGVIAYPTEGVWGLGCDPFNERATREILQLKDRPIEKGLILIASSIEQFDFLLHDLPNALLEKLQQSWPGPFTWVVPHYNRIPYWITGSHQTVALRVTNHPLVKALCDLTGPIVSTSANPAGLPSARSRLMVEKYFHKQNILVLNGQLGEAKTASRICDLFSGKVYR